MLNSYMSLNNLTLDRFLIASKEKFLFIGWTTFLDFFLKNSPVFQTKSLSKKNRKCLSGKIYLRKRNGLKRMCKKVNSRSNG